MKKVWSLLTTVAMVLSVVMVAPAQTALADEIGEFDSFTTYEWEPVDNALRTDDPYDPATGNFCAHGICIIGAVTTVHSQGFEVKVRYFTEPGAYVCDDVYKDGYVGATNRWDLWGGGYKQALKNQPGCAFVTPHWLGSGSGSSTYLAHEGFAPAGCTVSKLDGEGIVGGSSGYAYFSKFVIEGTCTQILKQTKWWTAPYGAYEGQVTINIADANGYASQTVPVNMRAITDHGQGADDFMSWMAWQDSPTLFVDDTTDEVFKPAIAASRCTWNEALAGISAAITINYGGTKDMGDFASNPHFSAVPDGEIWVVPIPGSGSSKAGYPAFGELDKAWISFDPNRDWFTTFSNAPGCGDDEITGPGYIDLQSNISHELGHAFADFLDLCSDPTLCTGNQVFVPAANCGFGTPFPQRGYTMCQNRGAGNGDPAAGRSLEFKEVVLLCQKYGVCS